MEVKMGLFYLFYLKLPEAEADLRSLYFFELKSSSFKDIHATRFSLGFFSFSEGLALLLFPSSYSLAGFVQLTFPLQAFFIIKGPKTQGRAWVTSV